MTSVGRWIVLYDAECGLCMWLLDLLLRRDRAGRLRPLPLQDADADELLAGLAPDERMASWHLVSPNGERCSGGAALAPLLRLLRGGTLPSRAFARFPKLTERGYRWVAANRSTLSRGVPARAKRRAAGRIAGRRSPGIRGT